MQELAKRVLASIQTLLEKQAQVIVAIDGRCAAGKTTLAAQIAAMVPCNVLHMDSFFLRSEQRTAARLAEPGGNVDYERFFTEALVPLCAGEPFCYRPYDCRTQSLLTPVCVTPCAINLVEGSYSCHPALWTSYDYRIFLTVEPDEQLRRIRLRNGVQCAERFRTQWIPLEERYFARFDIMARCDARFDTGSEGSAQ